MKKSFIFMTVLAVFALNACKGNNGDDLSSDPQEMTILAKMQATPVGTAAWAKGDAISVFDGKKNNTFTATEAGSEVVFKGIADTKAATLQAVYPAVSSGRQNGAVNVEIAGNQTAVKDGFDAKYMYCAAEAANDGKSPLEFTNAFALLKISISDPAIVSVQVLANGNETLSGNVWLTLSSDAKVEVNTLKAHSNTVGIVGDNLSGDYYIVAMPQTLSAGYTIAVTNDSDARAEIEVGAQAAFKANEVYDLGEVKNLDWGESVNPNPTEVVKTVIMKASFEEAEFNMLANGDFEHPFPGGQDPWMDYDANFASIRTYGSGYNSERGLKIDNPTPGVWYRAEQTLQFNRQTDYVFSIDGKLNTGNSVTYAGCDFWGQGLFEIVGWQGEWGANDQWQHYERTWYCDAPFWGFSYAGMWGDAGMVGEFDNIRVIPLGYEAKSMNTKNVNVLGHITNATYDEVDDLGKVMAWIDTEGKIKLVFSNVTIKGTKYPTAIAQTESTDPASIQITKFQKVGGVVAPAISPKEGQISIVPDDVFVRDGKTYMHYYATVAEDAANVNNWTTEYASFVVSEDNGATWTPTSGTWIGGAPGEGGHFASADFINKDGYTYMIGTYSGRDGWFWANMFGARAADGKDFTDPASYEVWNNPGWTEPGADPVDWAACLLSVGPRAEAEVIFNPVFNRYMMIYRADTLGGLVYRDSAGPQEDGRWFWSGEKSLTDDNVTGPLFDPSVLKIEADGSIIFVASSL